LVGEVDESGNGRSLSVSLGEKQLVFNLLIFRYLSSLLSLYHCEKIKLFSTTGLSSPSYQMPTSPMRPPFRSPEYRFLHLRMSRWEKRKVVEYLLLVWRRGKGRVIRRWIPHGQRGGGRRRTPVIPVCFLLWGFFETLLLPFFWMLIVTHDSFLSHTSPVSVSLCFMHKISHPLSAHS
jgi:hypothetical protein